MKLGSLFSGYGGLDQAIHSAFGDVETAWVSDFDAGPNKILAHRYPNVPNIGDITQIDWTQVEPVDIIAGGFPCQDVSTAGRRAGMAEGTRSNLWGAMRTAVEIIRPRFVVAENVRGLLSATATSDSDVEPGSGSLGDGGANNLRALGRVLGDLADLGYDAGWCGLRAADVGAPHGRFRVFIVAEDSLRGGSGGWTGVASDSASEQPNLTAHGTDSRPDSSRVREVTLLPTPTTSEANVIGAHAGSADLRTTIATTDFGTYTPAIERWEHILGRPAPSPTEPGRARPRLSARFVEWLMGLPDGHVTDTPGITRNEALKALGNGVVPLQCEAALRHLQEVRDAYM